MRAALGILLLAAGCDWAFGLTPLDAVRPGDDAGVIGDGVTLEIPACDDDCDGDGVLDVIDNCPGKSNSDQYNEDGDEMGDLCDPCPLTGVATDADGDSDGIDDACDPDPEVPDCLVVFDSFRVHIPAAWPLVQSGTGSVVKVPGDIVLTTDNSGATGTAGIAATGAGSALQVRISVPNFGANGFIRVVNRSTTGLLFGQACKVDGPTTLALDNVGAGPITTLINPSVSNNPAVVAMVDRSTFQCSLIRPGEATLTLSDTVTQARNGTTMGIVMTGSTGTTVTVNAAAIYEKRDGTCPAPIVR